ncbi:MAG: dienelactone hydrolase family protein [Simkaniaceae bacterium]|nr:dienelactone hydrolase family protein [Simkaniaceae bacterium]
MKKKKPAVLIFPAFAGRDQFACDMARTIAKLGYVGFAVDMYGKGIHPSTRREMSEHMMLFVDDRQKLRQRVLSAYETLKKLKVVDAHRIASIGFCFGGLCSLDLARCGVDLKAAVCFHGILAGLPLEIKSHQIKAKILICHGYDDPQIPRKQIASVQEEMTAQKVDWQLLMHGQTMHGFTNPEAQDIDFGILYHPIASKRSYAAMEALFKEVF